MEQITPQKQPKVTVITVCYNVEDTIEDTIASIVSQTAFADMELIVIDGASTDRTLERLRRFQGDITVLVSEPDRGIYNAMNKGIVLSRGAYINFMNAGDRFFNNRVIEEVFSIVEAMDTRPDVVYGATIDLYGDCGRIAMPNPALLPNAIGGCHQSIFVDGDLLRREKFDESFRITADFDLMVRLHRLGARFATVNRYVAIYNREGISSSPASLRLRYSERCRIMGRPDTTAGFYLKKWRTDLGRIRREAISAIRRRLGIARPTDLLLPLDQITQLTTP